MVGAVENRTSFAKCRFLLVVCGVDLSLWGFAMILKVGDGIDAEDRYYSQWPTCTNDLWTLL